MTCHFLSNDDICLSDAPADLEAKVERVCITVYGNGSIIRRALLQKLHAMKSDLLFGDGDLLKTIGKKTNN